MTETVKITLPSRTWTEVASGAANVTARVERKGVSRIYVGASAPSGLVGLPMERNEIVQFSNLETTDKVFLFAVDGSNAAWVIRG